MTHGNEGTVQRPSSLNKTNTSNRVVQAVVNTKEDTNSPALTNNKEDYTIPEQESTRSPHSHRHTLYKEALRQKELREKKLTYVNSLKTSLEEEGYKVHAFKEHGLEQVLDAIEHGDVIDQVDIVASMQDENFRFISYDCPETSLAVSRSMVSFAKASKLIKVRSVSSKAVGQLQDNADEFAKNVFEIVEKIKTKKKITTFNGIAAELNREKIKTFQKNAKEGSEKNSWHASTVSNLSKRWEKLGLVSSTQQPHL